VVSVLITWSLKKEGTVRSQLYAKCGLYLTNVDRNNIGATNVVERFHYTKIRRNAWVRQKCRANYSFILYTLPVWGTKHTSTNMECQAVNLGYVFVVISSEFKDTR